jgi:Fe-S cluster assembly protein SufD
VTGIALLSTLSVPEREPSQGLLEAAKAAIRARPGDDRGWLESRRTEAAVWLEAHGFPRQDEEAWRFTPTREVIRTPYALGIADLRVTTRDAHGVEVLSLLTALAKSPERIEPYLGRVAPLEDGFSALNGALWQDGIVVLAGRGARGRIELVNVTTNPGEPALTLPRVLVVAEEGSELTIVESQSASGASAVGAAPRLSASVTEIVVGEGARVEHVRILEGARAASSIASVAAIAVHQDRNSRYASRVFTFGGSLSRLDLRVTLGGEGAECLLDGLYFAGDGEVVDHHTTIDHARPHCSSRERYKGAIDGTGTAVFDGTVLVRHGAARTEAHQENRNLLLSGDAVIHTKPHLRIDADDVKCSHGATVGRLDPAQLFYLRSRGMDATVARSLLTYAFLREMTANAPEDLRSALDDRIAALFPDGAIAKELA